ncbi:unnamed protein product [Cyprideis torosa]|uniref:Uncharacterized protein n=1 Tax=Cyprideis torosa TaxID=163714 RepID=A0A7R8WRM0_9CRUS|nr:unnamed protein product [Cyprideis torosa]CAG0902726.1 unnamed protein product [Cyprideis torosa]
MSAKLTKQQLQRKAYVYVRQSTLGQVRWHQESTERQYALREKAQELGWPAQMIMTLDGDLGVSGAQTTGRNDFKQLVADVSMGEVGAVFALEASRLARSSLEWHRLIELCALTQTAVIDEDGCYDPADFNDALLLGLKGTLAQAELHFLRARLQGGKLNKARKGELKFPLPVGLCYDEQDRTVLDPDEEVRGAVQMVFDLFLEAGSAYGVVHRFAEKGLKFPKRSYGGAWDGQLIWGRLSESRVLSILSNPAYAGAYVYGRYQSKRMIDSKGEIQTHSKQVAIESWRVNLRDHHEGYISWDQFLQNRERLERNRTNAEETLLSGAAREGLALLQGLLLCGCCGRKLTVRYKGNSGIYPLYECNWRRREGVATKDCMAVRAELIDPVVCQAMLEAVAPEQLALAVESVRQLESRDQAVAQQWQRRIERANYEAQLAQRRYEEVDPSNRLVASTLERRWNDALEALQVIEEQYGQFHSKEACIVSDEQRAMVLALAEDLPRLWSAKTTLEKDKKRMLRLLIKDITVEKNTEQRQVVLHIRWQGGANTDTAVELPAPLAERLRYPIDFVEKIRAMASSMRDEEIVDELKAQGLRSAMGKVFTVSMISWIRYKHGIASVELKRSNELTVNEVMARFGVGRHVVYYWIERGVVNARQQKAGSPYWITITKAKEHELTDWVKNSSRIDVINNT